MKKTVDMIKEELVSAWKRDGLTAQTIDFENYSATITPCDKEGNIEDCDYFTVEYKLPLLRGVGIDHVCKELQHIENLLAEADDEKRHFLSALNEAQEKGKVDREWFARWYEETEWLSPTWLI